VKEQTINNRSGNLSKELNERMVTNQHEIEVNLVAQGNQSRIINNQQASLALLVDRSKN